MPKLRGKIRLSSPEVSEEEAGEVPECYTPKEWRLFFGAAKGSLSTSHHKFTLPWEAAMRAACEDCQVSYQMEQLRLGRCHPPSLEITPLFRPLAEPTDE